MIINSNILENATPKILIIIDALSCVNTITVVIKEIVIEKINDLKSVDFLLKFLIMIYADGTITIDFNNS